MMKGVCLDGLFFYVLAVNWFVCLLCEADISPLLLFAWELVLSLAVSGRFKLKPLLVRRAA